MKSLGMNSYIPVIVACLSYTKCTNCGDSHNAEFTFTALGRLILDLLYDSSFASKDNIKLGIEIKKIC
jgi:hypothetical protein